MRAIGTSIGATGLLLLDRSRKGPAKPAKTRERQSAEDKPRGALCCAACQRRITSMAARTEVSGAHEHTFVNPHGHVFHVGCFERAEGCMVIGGPSEFFSWFPGYAWRVEVCGGCHIHLGWAFGIPTRFHGLILRRLVDCEDQS